MRLPLNHALLIAGSIFLTPHAGCGHSAKHAEDDAVELTSESPLNLAIDATNVYWTSTGGGGPARDDIDTVSKIARTGGQVEHLASGSGSTAIAVDAVNVYWGAGDTVMKAPLSGGAPTVLATGQSSVANIALDAESVYWTDTGNMNVMKAPIAGGPPIALVTNQEFPTGLAVDTAAVYWTNTGYAINNGTIMKMGLDGAAPVVLARNQPQPWRMAVDSTNVYWTNLNAAPALAKVAINGGPVATVVAGNGAYALALTASSIYWTSVGNVCKTPLDGGATETLAVNPNAGILPSLAVDSNDIYWTTLSMVGPVGFGSVMGSKP